MSRNVELYHKLPIFLQNIACNHEGSKIKKRRYNDSFHSILDSYRKRETISKEELLKKRDDLLKRFLSYAFTHIPFYKANYFGVDVKSIQTIDDLQQLPILTKEEVRENLSMFISPSIDKNDTITAHTSGTTGKGLVFPVTIDAEHHQWAVWWRYRMHHDLEFLQPSAVFTGQPIVSPSQQKPPFWRENKAFNELIFSAYHLNQENLPYYIEKLNQSKISWLHGYPSNLVQIASHLIEHNRRLEYKVDVVTTGAESLLAHQKKMLVQAFDCPVVNHYGMAEGVANISECRYGNLHVDEDYSAVEFVHIKADKYKIIGSNFTNKAFPLIRYDTGDTATISDFGKRCECGNQGRIVDSIDGRIEDYIYLSDNTKIGRLDHLFKDAVHIKQAQIYQNEKGKMVIRIVKDAEYSEVDETQIKTEIEMRMKDKISYSFDYIPEIKKTSRGKLRFIESDIHDNSSTKLL